MRLIGLAVVLTLGLTLGSLAANAQPQPDKLWRIGVLMSPLMVEEVCAKIGKPSARR